MGEQGEWKRLLTWSIKPQVLWEPQEMWGPAEVTEMDGIKTSSGFGLCPRSWVGR